MSYQDGMAAIHLEMPKRVPRTEYSVESHWALVQTVTGIKVGAYSTPEIQQKARHAFIKAWNYDFIWSTHIYNQIFDGYYTKMGHATYAADGVDYSHDISCPFKDPEEVLNFDPWETYGVREKGKLCKDFEEYIRLGKESGIDAITMTGIYVTCLSGLIEIFGWDMLLLGAGTDAKRFGEMTNRYASWIQQYFDALSETDTPVVMIHDDIVWTSGAFMHPDWYRKYVFPNYKKYFAPLIDTGKKILYTSDGNYTEFIDDIASTGVHGFVMEPSTDMKYIAEKYGKTHVFVGNADTRILLSGTRQQIRTEVERCMNIGKACPGFFMAVGNHIPANTPVENALYYNEVYDELSVR